MIFYTFVVFRLFKQPVCFLHICDFIELLLPIVILQNSTTAMVNVISKVYV